MAREVWNDGPGTVILFNEEHAATAAACDPEKLHGQMNESGKVKADDARRRLGTYRAPSNEPQARPVFEKTLYAGTFRVGAPRFELGTSSPPDQSSQLAAISPEWPEMAQSREILSSARGFAALLHERVPGRLGH